VRISAHEGKGDDEMSDLDELYQEVIIDHNKNPCNFRKIENHDSSAEGYNPMCGDHFTVYLKFKNDIIEDISFQGVGCALSKASASIMTSELIGKSRIDAIILFNKVHEMLTGEKTMELDELGKLAAFSGAHQFPMRVKCVTLAWHAMRDAISEKTS
jgi:nitrogen fixation NifU-like protein